MHAEPALRHAPRLRDLMLLLPVSLLGMGVPLGMIDVVNRLNDPMYGGASARRIGQTAGELGWGLAALAGILAGWIAVCSSDASLQAHPWRAALLALGLVAGLAVAVDLIAGWQARGVLGSSWFDLVFVALLTLAPGWVAVTQLGRIGRLRRTRQGARHGQ